MKTTFRALLLCGVVAAAPTFLHAQTSNTTVKDELFAGTEKFAKGASDVEEITMDPDSLARVSGSSGAQAHGMVLNVVRTYSYPKPGMYNIADVEEFRNKINTGEWHCSVHISHPLKGESTDVCEHRRTDGMHESAIITVEPKELTFIHKITRDRTPGPQSWSVFPNLNTYGGTYSSAEMHAETEVAMAEMHANMAGMNIGLWKSGFAMPLERSASSARELQHLGEEWKGMQPRPPAPTPEKNTK